MKGLISKPVAEGKGVNKKIKIKKGNESKFDSQTLRFFPPSKQDYNSLWKTHIFRSKECLACLFKACIKHYNTVAFDRWPVEPLKMDQTFITQNK